MASVFVQLAHDPSAGAQAQRAFLVASAAAELGHTVSMFLAGGAVSMLAVEHLDAVTAFGATLRTYLDVVLAHGGEVFASAEAVRARGLDEAALQGERVTFTAPDKIVELAVACDTTITYG